MSTCLLQKQSDSMYSLHNFSHNTKRWRMYEIELIMLHYYLNMFNRTRLRAEGFFLIDILVALALFSIATVSIAFYQWHVVIQQRETLNRMHALTIARNTIETARAHRRSPAILHEKNDQFTITIRSRPLSVTSYSRHKVIPSLTGEDLNIIEVRVSWQSLHGESRSVCLVSCTADSMVES